MRQSRATLLLALLPAFLFLAAAWRPAAAASPSLLAAAAAPPAPALDARDPARWFNSPPLDFAELRGKVVLLDFWTFGCWNCYRSLPWLNALEERLGDADLRVIGVHTPEFDREKVAASVAEKITEFNVKHPVVMDNDMRIWRAFGNRYWPAFYLVDRNGRVRALFAGETHAGDRQALAIEAAITALLAEPAAAR